MISLPIRLILGNGVGEARGMTILYELSNGSVGQHTIKFATQDFLKVRFTDGDSVIVLEEKKKMFGAHEYVVASVLINRHIQLP